MRTPERAGSKPSRRSGPIIVHNAHHFVRHTCDMAQYRVRLAMRGCRCFGRRRSWRHRLRRRPPDGRRSPERPIVRQDSQCGGVLHRPCSLVTCHERWRFGRLSLSCLLTRLLRAASPSVRRRSGAPDLSASQSWLADRQWGMTLCASALFACVCVWLSAPSDRSQVVCVCRRV